MVVVAIIGLVAAMGVPALNRMLIKEGMRKAVSDITDVCKTARARAIFSGHTVAVVIHPGNRSFEVDGGGSSHGSPYVSSGTLPDGVELKRWASTPWILRNPSSGACFFIRTARAMK